MTPRIVTAIGGSWSAIGRYPRSIKAQINLIDVQKELDKVHTPPEVGKYALAAGETVTTVANALGSELLKEYAAQVGNSSADDGADASRLIGDSLARFEIDWGRFSAWAADRRNALVIEYGDNISRYELCTVAGASGGIGAGGTQPLEKAIAKKWRDGGYSFHRHLIRLGPKSHTRTDASSSDLTERNAASVYCDDLYQFLVSPILSAYETREITNAELPLSDFDERLREFYAATCVQALLCSELRARQTAYTVNGSNPLKRITLAQASWFQKIDPVVIQSDAFATYAKAIQKLLAGDSATSRVACVLQVDPTCSPAEVTVVAELVERALGKDFSSQEILAAAAQSPCKVQVEPAATVSTKRVELLHLERFFNSFGPSFSDFTSRRACVESLLLAVRQELVQWQRTARLFRGQLHNYKQSAASTLCWSFGRGGYLSQLTSAGQLLTKKKMRLTSKFEVLRSAASEFHRAEVVVTLLGTAETQLLEEKARLEKTVKNIIRCLESFKPSGAIAHSVVEMEPMEIAWPWLSVMKADNYIENGRTLCSLVRYVTPRGLQQLVGASDCSVESILSALHTSTPTMEGPHWGGDTTRSYNSTVYVLPPVRESLREGFLQRSKGTVLFADGAAAGVTVIRLRLATPTTLSEIFTHAIFQRFEETLGPNVRDNFYPGGVDSWVWLKQQLVNEKKKPRLTKPNQGKKNRVSKSAANNGGVPADSNLPPKSQTLGDY